ncbi:hypothetical protein ATANTOWER_018888 [Ataeniobius toweri]|uniref:Secreted protein n=1 Tax=Ataeniobius toweri TaxID=208326 RepID=A0ABU7CHC2_9TELE|nr:hypothetical protein [Ataeniobius toweri]
MLGVGRSCCRWLVLALFSWGVLVSGVGLCGWGWCFVWSGGLGALCFTLRLFDLGAAALVPYWQPSSVLGVRLPWGDALGLAAWDCCCHLEAGPAALCCS